LKEHENAVFRLLTWLVIIDETAGALKIPPGLTSQSVSMCGDAGSLLVEPTD